MTPIENIKEAIVFIDNGVLHITFGRNINDINQNNKNFHDRVSIEVKSGGSEILVKGHKIDYEVIYDPITEYHKNFKLYNEKLIGFEEKVEVSKIFTLFRNLKIENFKNSFSLSKLCFDKFKVFRPSLCGDTFIYKKEFWNPVEYKANNWVFKELKPIN